ncbi:hypothetical protein ACLOJK_030927 [Asimina triloba]
MSAIVCGKRSLFEDIHSPPQSVPSKRLRCSPSASPLRLSPPRLLDTSPTTSAIDRLRSLFPDMDRQLLERALEACGNDLDSAIRSLNELCLGSGDKTLDSAESKPVQRIDVQLSSQGGDATTENVPASNLPADGSEWVELLVREMMNASDMDDARARASRVLEVLEKSILDRAGAEAAERLKESVILKQQVEALVRDNTILKRAVAIQYERQKECDERNLELQHLKQRLIETEEQLNALKISLCI